MFSLSRRRNNLWSKVTCVSVNVLTDDSTDVYTEVELTFGYCVSDVVARWCCETSRDIHWLAVRRGSRECSHANDRLRGPIGRRDSVWSFGGEASRLQWWCTKWWPSAWPFPEEAQHLRAAPCPWRIHTEDWGVLFRTPNNISLIHHKVRETFFFSTEIMHVYFFSLFG